MSEPCGSYLGHEKCNFVFITKEHEGHKAAPEAYKNSKNHVYKRKVAKQSR